MSLRELQATTVLITGASFGVGKATALAFHDAGANVVMVARRVEPLREAAAGLERALIVAADVLDAAAMKAAMDAAVTRFGSLSGLVNNAGAHLRGRFETRTTAEIATMVDVNLRAPIVLSHLAFPYLRAAGGGFIVNVGSLAGKLPLEGASTYSATKFGLRCFTVALAQELRGSGIRVSVVSPGPVDTGFILEELEQVEDIVFSQPMCTAAEVAEMILACARDGKLEREFPRFGAKLATLGHLLPEWRRFLKPLLSEKGRRFKQRLRDRRA